MRLNFIGRGSAFNPALKSTGAYSIVNNNFYLIDCGESAFSSIWKMEELQTCDNIFILITHLHADHVGSLGSLISYCYCVLKRKVTVVHPETAIVELLDLQGIERFFYDYTKSLPDNTTGILATAVAVEHVGNMRCYGYILRSGESCVYYSGDSFKIPADVLADFKCGKIQNIYQDTSLLDKKEPSHCYIGWLENNIAPKDRGRVYCMHLDEGFEIIESRGFNVVEVKAQ